MSLATSQATRLTLTNASIVSNFPFKWSNAGFTYLGLKISPDTQDLWKLNFAPILTAVKQDLIRWHDLPLSLIGRISLIKMNILPRILYPLQMLSLRISKKINKDLERSFSKLIWHGKRQRQRFGSLQLPKDKGDLAVPNLPRTWLHSYLKHETCMDSWVCSPESLWSLVTCRPEEIKINIKNNPLIINSIKVWQDISEYMERWGVKSMLSPICNNQDFIPGLRLSLFESWHDKGIHVIGDMFENNILMSF